MLGGKIVKKIIILTSTGGGGHISVSSALKNYLKHTYKVEDVLPFKHILKSLDPLMSTVFGCIDGENIYNFLLRKKYFTLANLLYSLGEHYFSLRSGKIRTILECYFMEKKPDLVISVIPIINQDIFLATKKLGIPFLLIPTDLDATTFLHRLNGADHPHFKLSLAFDDDDIHNTVQKNGINNNYITINGFPLRPDFFKDKNKDQIRKQFDIPDYKQSILLLMGTQGSNDMLRFVKELAKLDTPIHLMCCIGKNETVRSMLKSIQLPNHISLSIIGFTQQISDLMAVSDLIITKSGSVSVCETIYSNRPAMLDATSTVLRWERFNHHFFKKHKMGGILSAGVPIAKQVRAVLTNKDLLTMFKRNLCAYDKKQPAHDLPNLIDQMVANKLETEKKASVQEAYIQLSLTSAVKHK